MRYFFGIMSVTVGVLVACTGNSTQTEIRVDSDTAATSVASDRLICYAYATPNDSIQLRLTSQSEAVTGDLEYRLAEKDDNTGTIQGQMRGDTLFAEYTFSSEGTQSVREVAFLKRGDSLLEGYGDTEERNGQVVFKNKAKLIFDSTTVLIQRECK